MILFISLISLCLRYGFGRLFVVVADLRKKTLNTLPVHSGVRSYLFETNVCMLFSTAYRAWFMYIAMNNSGTVALKKEYGKQTKLLLRGIFFLGSWGFRDKV
jgi:hypothetical protein